MLEVGNPQAISTRLKVSARHFVCLLVWDSEEEPVGEISRVAEVLLGSGCVYLCTWGSGCKKVHDIADAVSVAANPGPADDSVVMTTSHEDETLDDALWFFLRCTFPDQPYEDSCRAAVAVLIGGNADHPLSRIRHALTDTGRFSEEVLDA